MPELKPIEVASAHTKAEWLEGMPPVRQKSRAIRSFKSETLPFKSCITVFINCAESQLNTAESKTGFISK